MVNKKQIKEIIIENLEYMDNEQLKKLNKYIKKLMHKDHVFEINEYVKYEINADILKLYRNKRKISQYKLAESIDKSSTYIYKLEKGQIKMIRGKIIKTIAKMIEIEPCKLINNKNREKER